MNFIVHASKVQEVNARLARLGVREADLQETFIRGGGAGGQKINKTSSCVVLVHKPSGTEVRCQRERSQALNRFLARRELCEKLEERRLGEASRRQQEREKIRRQKRRRSRRQKARMLDEKRQHAAKKDLRKSPGLEF